MALELETGKTIRVTISKTINRASARKTIERLFMKDKSIVRPLLVRSRNFKEQPKRRGGQIWTKRPNKIHCSLERGDAATIKTTPQAIRDLQSVDTFVAIAPL
jgi:hypothetical protein